MSAASALSRAGARPSWAMPAPAIVVPSAAPVTPSGCGCGGAAGACACKGSAAGGASRAAATPVYAFGSLRMTYPSKSLEAEMQRALDAMHVSPGAEQYFAAGTGYGLELLSQGEYDYLLRDACFILSIGKIDAYLVQARSYAELYSMVAATNQYAVPTVYSAVIGQLGPIAGPGACNGLQLPIVYCDQVFSFQQRMLEEIFEVKGGGPKALEQAQAMSQLLFQMTDNTGASPEHRALNYVALRYPLIYDVADSMYKDGYRLLRVEAMPSDVEGARDVVFVYQERDVGRVTQWRCSIDVSGMYPFIARRLSQSYPAHPSY